jgi:hypothetical protein
MEAYAKKLAGKKAKLEKLIKKEKGFWIEDFNGFNKKLYKIWACVDELKKGDILTRIWLISIPSWFRMVLTAMI